MPHRPDGARGIRLREVLPEAELHGARELCVTSCTTDWRKCRPGDLFVATAEGTAEHDIEQALARGAVGVVCERRLDELDVPTCVVADARSALGRICQALAGHPSRRLNVVGITGSRGKTTTSHLIAGVLSAGGFQPGLLGSLGFCDGVDTRPAPRGGPTAPMLATWLGRGMANGCTHVVMEISAQSLDESRIAGIDLDMACVTNVLEDEPSDSQRQATIGKVFNHLMPEGVAVLSADDASTRVYLDEVDTPALTVGIDSPAELSATLVEQTLSDQTFLLSAGSETIPVRTSLVGIHNVHNCLFAAAVGFGYGMDLAAIARGLESIESVPGRLERVKCGQPFGVFVDASNTPDRLAAALRTLRQHTAGRLLCVFAGSGELERFDRTRLGRTVDRLADAAVATETTPRTDETIGDVLLGFRPGSRVRAMPERTEAIRWMLHQARAGDCVLIAGGGSEESVVSEDDRELTKECLYDRVPAEEFQRAVA